MAIKDRSDCWEMMQRMGPLGQGYGIEKSETWEEIWMSLFSNVLSKENPMIWKNQWLQDNLGQLW